MSDMTVVSKRRERSRKLCRLLSERIGEVTPPGLGRWDPAWERVRGPSTRFLDALGRWEASGQEDDMDRAKALALDVLEAWKQAERKYRDLDRPHTPEEVPA